MSEFNAPTVLCFLCGERHDTTQCRRPDWEYFWFRIRVAIRARIYFAGFLFDRFVVEPMARLVRQDPWF